MMKVLFYLLIITILSVQLYSQNYEFCVLGKVGSVYVQIKGNKNWLDLKTGDQLKKNDLISLKDNSYIGLVHSSGKTMELLKPGEYKISKLVDDLKENSASIIPNLLEVIFGKKSNLKELLDSKQSRKVFTKGAIERGIELEHINVMSPRKIILLSNTVELVWGSVKPGDKYELKVTDRFSKLIFTKVITDTSLLIEQHEMKLDKDQYYFWRVNLMDNPEVRSDEGYFLFYSDGKIADIKNKVDIMKKEMSGKESALSKILLAFYYENNLLLNEADKEFREAIAISPDVKDYKELYVAFKQRMNINR